MRDGLADEGVGVRHGAAILAPSTPSGWLYDRETRLRLESALLISQNLSGVCDMDQVNESA